MVIYLRKTMFFTEIYTIIINGHIEFHLAAILVFFCKKDDPDNNIINKIYAYFMFVILILIIPASIIYIIM